MYLHVMIVSSRYPGNPHPSTLDLHLAMYQLCAETQADKKEIKISRFHNLNLKLIILHYRVNSKKKNTYFDLSTCDNWEF